MNRFEFKCAFCPTTDIPHNLFECLDEKGNVVYICRECYETHAK